MNPRDTQEQIGLFHPATPPASVERIAAIRAEAAAARDAAIGAALRRAFTGIGRFFATIGTALLTFPERRATYERLRALSDRELADIGLTRDDIAKVFDLDHGLPVRAANTNEPSGKPRAA